MRCFTDLGPIECMQQMDRIAESLGAWISVTEVDKIRKRVPAPSEIKPGMTDEERRSAVEDFQRRKNDQAIKNLLAMVHAVFGEHPRETLELLALICCVPAEEAESHKLTEYLTVLTKALTSEDAMGFFTSFRLLVQMATSGR